MPDDFGAHIWNIITDIDGVAKDLYYRYLFRPQVLNITTSIEQAPNPNSRVFLGDERDSLGMRRVKLDWRMTELVWRTERVVTELIGREIGRLGLGRVRMADWLLTDDAAWPSDLWVGHHHIGTTRMADDPKNGVVDANCRLHGTDNLYIAGSSVFPTSGHDTPTITIVALALRLADHLKERLD